MSVATLDERAADMCSDGESRANIAAILGMTYNHVLEATKGIDRPKGKARCREMRSRLYPPSATSAMPGSRDKILVMRQRMLGGYDLYHRDDAVPVLEQPPPYIEKPSISDDDDFDESGLAEFLEKVRGR